MKLWGMWSEGYEDAKSCSFTLGKEMSKAENFLKTRKMAEIIEQRPVANI